MTAAQSPRPRSPAGQRGDPITRLAGRLWIDWPRRTMRRFPGSRGLAGDGHFLVTVPPLAVLAPLATVAWFLFVGSTHRGYDVVWSESLALVVALLALGTLSGMLGVLGVTALAIGDFALGTSWEVVTGSLTTDLLQVRLPMVITYLLLAVAVVVVPRTGRGLAAAVGRARRIPGGLAWPLASLVVLVVAWIGTSTWAAAAPTLIRPRFTWSGGAPTVEAIATFQQDTATLITAAVVAVMVRQFWIGATMLPGAPRRALRRAESRPLPATRARTATRAGVLVLPGTVRRSLSDAVAAGLATLVLAGVLEQAWLWVLAFVVFLAIRLLRSGVIAAPRVDRWKVLASRLPAVVRLVVLWVLARVVTNALSNGAVNSYTGVALFVIVGSVVVWAVFPGRSPAPPQPPPEAPGGAATPPPPPPQAMAPPGGRPRGTTGTRPAGAP